MWRLEELLNSSCHNHDASIGFAESTGVFRCKLIAGTEGVPEDPEGIMKIWLQQDPADFDTSLSPSAHLDELSMAHQEAHWLQMLQNRDCKSTPRWHHSFFDKQSKHMPCPGSFLHCIVMQKLPGENLMDFHEHYSRAQRDEIRKAFEKALKYVNGLLSGCYPRIEYS